MLKGSLIVRMLFLIVVILFIGGCVTARNYELKDAAPDRVARLAITTDTLGVPRWYLLTNYSLQFSIFRVSEAKQEKPLYMGRVVLTSDAPRQIISIPAGEPLIISAYYSSQVANSITMCRPSTKIVAEPDGYYELLFHNENNVCTLQMISSKENELNERSEMKKLNRP